MLRTLLTITFYILQTHKPISGITEAKCSVYDSTTNFPLPQTHIACSFYLYINDILNSAFPKSYKMVHPPQTASSDALDEAVPSRG